MDIQTVIAQRPLGLVFDIDGTLSPIAPTPDEARLHRDVAALLEQARQKVHVAIMTGRAIDDGASMVNVEGLTYIGTHGLEWSEGLPETHQVSIIPAALQYVVPGAYLLDLVEQQLAELPGIIVQRKRIGGTIHYRRAADPEQARQHILALLEEPARRVNMRLSEGKKVVEIKVPLAIDKGQALRQYVQQHELRGVLFAGDDITDLDAILEIPKLRQEGIAALSIVVQHHDTFPDVLKYADITVQEVDGMVELLKDIVKQF
ncbi:MAG: trehalose-phosphatase [Chloroflexota bacterium]|nr:trehalose-phosphatase [Chloroflexota bacterium]